MTNEKIATKVAEKLVKFLNGKEIETSVVSYRPISKVLRSSWYVDKVRQLGYTDCVYVEAKECGFFAVLETGEIMTGGNCMICDAISSVIYHLLGVPDFDAFLSLKVYADYNSEDDGLLIGSYDKVTGLIERFTN